MGKDRVLNKILRMNIFEKMRSDPGLERGKGMSKNTVWRKNIPGVKDN